MPAEKKDKDDIEQTEQAAEETQTSAEELDFAEMDLTVEAVEERISPSETNVFDK